MESMSGLKRTKYCGMFRASDIGEKAVVFGWVQRMRNLGGLIFIDLRDRTGVVQCTFDEAINKELFDKAFTVRSEYVLAVAGVVRSRGSDINRDKPTGEVEILASELRILSKAETPPFEIVEDSDVNDMLRLKYRYLDLRRPDMQQKIALRHRITKLARDYFDGCGFYEIETPMLTKSTPEGARDYLVPSRVHPGKFYALPQSPQQYKQLLMLAGFDRYMQVTRCFRDEDLRADRQPEFTQLDLEMSFVDIDDVIEVNEGFISLIFREILNLDMPSPFPRMKYREAMERFGTDKPDLRFGYELCDITDIVKNSGFKVFSGAVESGGSVRLINVNGAAEKISRRDIDALGEFVKTYRAKGLAWIKYSNGEVSSSFAKFMTEEELSEIKKRANAKDGDILFVVADASDDIVFASLGALRLECARRLNVIDESRFNVLWITDFPLLEYDEEGKRFVAKHHPFTSPMDEDIDLIRENPAAVRAKAYDIIINGTEVGGGSIRIHSTELQELMFETLGFSKDEAHARFGHLIEAFSYGAPPHGGIAYGLDRLTMLMAGCDSIRDVIAFPKVQNASEPMMASPDYVDKVQLDELHIKLLTEN